MSSQEKWFAALPVFNEVNFVDRVLDEVVQHVGHVLVVDDGSTDGTADVLARRRDVTVIRHQQNRGYGAALITAFEYAADEDFDGLVTLDCDGQHQPKRIPEFVAAAAEADIVSGSRYLQEFQGDDAPPPERLKINRMITDELNHRLGFDLTDAFCGFKAYRTEGLKKMRITDQGYAMPLQLWVEAAAAGLRVIEIPVPLIYLDLERSFGGSLDQAQTRLKYYHKVLDEAFASVGRAGVQFPPRREVLSESTAATGQK